MKIMVWTCYFQGPSETELLITETREKLSGMMRDRVLSVADEGDEVPTDPDDACDWLDASGIDASFGRADFCVIDAAACEVWGPK